VTAFEKVPLNQLLSDFTDQKPEEDSCKQLLLFNL
jgi:hypothetical protein